MFQKEVAQRIVAAPGTPAYGRLAVLAQWRATARIAFEVNRAAFVPPPKVTSAVVHILPATMPAGVSPARLEAITAAAFGQRRKMLRQSLKALPGGEAAMEHCGIDPTRRAETLEIDEFVALARALSRLESRFVGKVRELDNTIPPRRTEGGMATRRAVCWTLGGVPLEENATIELGFRGGGDVTFAARCVAFGRSVRAERMTIARDHAAA